MKQIQKIPLAILGACNKVMGIFIPISVALLLINTSNIPIDDWSAIILLTIAFASTLFRGIQVWIK